MIKKVFRGLGRVLKPLVNVPAWMGWKSLQEDNQRLGRLAKSVLFPEKTAAVSETFEQAVERLGLDEASIQARQRYLKRAATCYLALASVVFIYAIYLLVFVKVLLGFAAVMVMVWVALTLAFKQHFWYTQMKQRRLGLSFIDWFRAAFYSRGV